MASRTWLLDIRSMSCMWMSLVEMNVWMRQRSAPFSASAARSMSPGTTRASDAMTGPRTLVAISRTASNSPSELMANPASMTSTFSRASCSAISTFSALVSAMPGACSPSRRVVSKMRTWSAPGTTPGVATPEVFSLIARDRLLLGFQPGHHLAQAPPHVLQLGRPRLAPKSLELREPALGLGDPLLGELAALDLVEDPSHLLPRPVVHDARTAGVVAVLGRVADRV